ncbi:MAG: Hsp70 family protein [Spirochaetales bacterium]|nr:Hsp70 family protein [Spirochaetales bacterium]MCF7937589.1 Hsp70 family protein [Spirochaetales bacterium]
MIGIDLGTTNSAVAFWDEGEARIIPNSRGGRVTPSVVGVDSEGTVLVGESAKNQAVIHPDRTVLAVKRAMGKGKSYRLGEREFSPEEVSSQILRELKKAAQDFLDCEVREAVVTVPAHFTEHQRRATKEAGRLAGLEVRRILNEPTAAALAGTRLNGFRHPGLPGGGETKRDQTGPSEKAGMMMVYDFGGGTFDVSVLRKEGGEYHVLSSRGDNHLGGVDFDRMILEEVLDRFESDSGIKLSDDQVLVQQLQDQTERAKIELSSRNSSVVSLPFVGAGGRPVHLRYELERNRFDEIIAPFVERTIELCLAALRDAGAGMQDLGGLILAGGSTRIPLVQSYLSQVFGLRPESGLNPDEIVALGAAVQASMLEEQNEDISLNDITPFSLGVEIDEGNYIPVLRRHSPIPSTKSMTFTTIANNQRSVEIHVLQGESEAALENVSLGRFLLSGIRAAPRGEPMIEVVFSMDADGLLNVEAWDQDTGARQRVSLSSRDDQMELDPESLKNRVRLLQNRVIKLTAEADVKIESGFREEINDILRKTDRSLIEGDATVMRESLISLETVTAELLAVLEDSEEAFGEL